MADISNLIERRLPMEERLGLELRSLVAQLDRSDSWPHATIRGDIRLKARASLASDTKIIVSASDASGRILGTNLHYCSGEETFELFVGLSGTDVAKITIYPIASGAADNDPTQPSVKTSSKSLARKLHFQEEIGLLTQEFGYHPVSLPTNKEEGVDMVVEKNGRRVAVRVKFRSGGNVGNEEVKKLLDGMAGHKATEALFITTSQLSGRALELCAHANVVYIDHDRLLKFCTDHQLCLPSWCWLTKVGSDECKCLDREITVGRDTANDIAISDPHLSRQHFKLTWDRLSLWIEDCGSSNGTRVNGHRISRATRLAYGSRIGAGQHEWVVAEQAVLRSPKGAVLL